MNQFFSLVVLCFLCSSAQTAPVIVCRSWWQFSTKSDTLSTEERCPFHPLCAGNTNSNDHTTPLTPIKKIWREREMEQKREKRGENGQQTESPGVKLEGEVQRDEDSN